MGADKAIITDSKPRPLSRLTPHLIGQPMFHLLARAQEFEKIGKRVIHFEIGDPGFASPVQAKAAAKNALDHDLTHYTNSMGMYEFREAVARYTELNWGFLPSLDQVLICPANAAIDFVARCVVNPGEEVIYPDPGFPTYYSVLNYNGIVPIGIKLKEEKSFRMDPMEIKKRITEKTRLIIINSPQNPTGSVMTQKEVKQIAELAREHNLYLLSDEVYSQMIYDKVHYSPSLLDNCGERTVLLNSLSKTYAMSGWRLGYVIGPAELVKKMGLLLQTIMSCLPAFTQLGGIAAILGDQQHIIDRRHELKKRRDLLVKGLNELPGVSCLVPDGAFYAFPRISGTGLSADELSSRMLNEAGVCVLPGNCFGRFGENYVRLCYASTDIPMIEEALGKMDQFLRRK